jgi:hypothetical protein
MMVAGASVRRRKPGWRRPQLRAGERDQPQTLSGSKDQTDPLAPAAAPGESVILRGGHAGPGGEANQSPRLAIGVRKASRGSCLLCDGGRVSSLVTRLGISSTTRIGGWSASSSLLPTTRSDLRPKGIVSPTRQLGTVRQGWQVRRIALDVLQSEQKRHPVSPPIRGAGRLAEHIVSTERVREGSRRAKSCE